MPASHSDFNPPLFHFTHIRNLPKIFGQGCLLCDSRVQREDLGPVECASQDIKRKRQARVVPIPPGGTVSDYVPFYFASKSPMLYVINKGKVPTYSGGQDELVYLISSVREITSRSLASVFSDGNCAAHLTKFSDITGDITTFVDWEVMGADRWANTEDDNDRKRRRQAEFLVHDAVPLDAVTQLATRSPAMAREVRSIMDHQGIQLPIAVRPGWY